MPQSFEQIPQLPKPGQIRPSPKSEEVLAALEEAKKRKQSKLEDEVLLSAIRARLAKAGVNTEEDQQFSSKDTSEAARLEKRGKKAA